MGSEMCIRDRKYALRLLSEGAGDDGEYAEGARQIDRRSRAGAYPVGLWVLLAVVFLAIMSVLFFAV